METTRSFPSVRTAETSLPAADKPICHEVIKRHVLYLQELARGFVPPKPEAAHPPRRQTMAIVCPAEQPWGHTDEPSSPQNATKTPQMEHESWQHLAQHPQRCPHTAQGCPWPAHTGDTAQEPCVIPPVRCNTQGTQPTQLLHDKQSQSSRLDVSWVIPLSQSFCLS